MILVVALATGTVLVLALAVRGPIPPADEGALPDGSATPAEVVPWE